MITAWRLANFKSIRGPVELTLAPLTCITGANSSGKSTVLQSMLMVAQTTRYSPPWVPLALNGPMVNLGTLDDVRTRGVSAAEPLSVGFDIARTEEVDRPTARCDLVFDGGADDGARDNARPSLRAAEVGATVGRAESRASLRAALTRVSGETAVRRLGRTMTVHGAGNAGQLHQYEMVLHVADAAGQRDTFEGASLRHFLPDLVVQSANGVTLAVPLGFNWEVQRRFCNELLEMRALLAERVATRMIHPRINTASPDDVGLFGEFFVTAFAARADQVCLCVTPEVALRPDAAAVAHWGQRLSVWTLRQAVTAWLKHLGVAESLEVIDRGPLGHEVKVNVSGERDARYLTQVGSGVAQALPVVVMCLASQPGATLLIELPELHLHPAVQTRLGDFFLAMALSGRQVIVETHSEYIINRLRRRIAASAGDSLVPLVQIYFAEKKDGASTFQALPIDRYGAFERWPDGFFDDSQIEIEQILLAGADKMDADADAMEAAGERGG